MAKWFSKQSMLSEDTLQGTQFTNPADICHFHVVVGGVNSVDTGAVAIQIELQFIVVFTEPKVVAQSVSA